MLGSFGLCSLVRPGWVRREARCPVRLIAEGTTGAVHSQLDDKNLETAGRQKANGAKPSGLPRPRVVGEVARCLVRSVCAPWFVQVGFEGEARCPVRLIAEGTMGAVHSRQENKIFDARKRSSHRQKGERTDRSGARAFARRGRRLRSGSLWEAPFRGCSPRLPFVDGRPEGGILFPPSEEIVADSSHKTRSSARPRGPATRPGSTRCAHDSRREEAAG